MKYRMILIGKDGDSRRLDAETAELVRASMCDALGGGRVGDALWLGSDEACEIPCESAVDLPEGVLDMLEARRVDVACLSASGRRKGCLVSDMDSTVIEEESLDILAERLGLAMEVSAITDRAMGGAMDFAEALRQRARFLEGVSESLLEEVARSLTLRSGAKILTRAMRARGGRSLLVSGGFDVFVSHIAERAGFDDYRANRLEVRGGVLTGSVLEPIGGADAKRLYAEDFARALGLGMGDVLGVGDGANDRVMLESVGLGVGYKARSVLGGLGVHLRHSDLTGLLYLQGYRREDFAPD